MHKKIHAQPLVFLVYDVCCVLQADLEHEHRKRLDHRTPVHGCCLVSSFSLAWFDREEMVTASTSVRWRIVAAIVAAYIVVVSVFALLSGWSPSSAGDASDTRRDRLQRYRGFWSRGRHPIANQDHGAPIVGAGGSGGSATAVANSRRLAAVTALARATWQMIAAARGDPARPLSGGADPSAGPAGCALAAHDAVDTLILMGLEEEASHALRLVLRGAPLPSGLLIGEAAQRFVGGMLGAFSLTEDQRFLDRAIYHASAARTSAFGAASAAASHERAGTNITTTATPVSADAASANVVPGRFISTPGFEIGGAQSEQYDGRRPVSEIFSLAVPFVYLSSVTTDASYAEHGTRFQRWAARAGLLIAPAPVSDQVVEARKTAGVAAAATATLDSAFVDAQYGIAALPRIGLLPCFVRAPLATTLSGRGSSVPRQQQQQQQQPLFSGSIGVGPFGRFQLDSYLKQWLLGGKRSGDPLIAHYEGAVDALFTTLARYTSRSHFAILTERSVDVVAAMSTTDACAVPGILALGLMHGAHAGESSTSTSASTARRPWSWGAAQVEAFASDLLTTCVSVLLDSPTRMMPRTVRVRQHAGSADASGGGDGGARHQHQPSSAETLTFSEHEDDRRGSLKPALASSLFYFYRYTKDDGLREIGAELLAAIQRHSPTGAALRDVTVGGPAKRQGPSAGGGGGGGAAPAPQSPETHEDSADSDFLSQTLKFLFLLFSDESVVPLDRFVFDHGGHPYRI